jgi:hypothetical protein
MIFSLKKAYPCLGVNLIGKTLCQREIYSLHIGKSENPLLIAAGFHGQEWMTSLLALRFAELILRAKACRSTVCGIDVFDLQGLCGRGGGLRTRGRSCRDGSKKIPYRQERSACTKSYEKYFSAGIVKLLKGFKGTLVDCYYEMDEGSVMYLESKIKRLLETKTI